MSLREKDAESDPVTSTFLRLLIQAGEELPPIKRRLALQGHVYSLVLALDSSPPALRQNPISIELRSTTVFQNLVEFVMEQELLFRPLLGLPLDEELKGTDEAFATLNIYIQLLLLRVLCAAHQTGKNPEAELTEFVHLVKKPQVTRTVVLPLMHLKSLQGTLELGELGQLRTVENEQRDAPKGMVLPLGIPRCKLFFSVQTKPFVWASDFPLDQAIRTRVVPLRLVLYPLISYNHFTVQHLDPWEFPLRDEDFVSRFWSRGAPSQLEPMIMTQSHVGDVIALKSKIDMIDWNRATPWRLAVDRLDDAVFKVECGSPDAILDLVIGLESLFMTSDDKQESTHKVATRVARYIEASPERRKETFRDVKRLYGLRSKVAHGQRWELDSQGMARVEEAANLLVRVLRKMLETDQSEIDVITLDLG